MENITEISNKRFVFLIQMVTPDITIITLLEFFKSRNVLINMLNMQTHQSRLADVMILCSMERDRIRRTIDLISKMDGILEFEWLESRGTVRVLF